MAKLIVLYPKPDDPAHFKAYYRDHHVPLAAKIPGIKTYSYGYPQAAGGGEAPHFCVFEAVFDSGESLRAALGSPEANAAVADVPNYSPKGATMMTMDDEKIG